MRVSKLWPRWAAKPWDTRAVIAGYFVDYPTADGAPTAEQVLAIAEPTPEQLANRGDAERGFTLAAVLAALQAGNATNAQVQRVLAYLLKQAGA